MDRTLGQPPPELWPEFSEVERLANHLGEFGEISISRLEPEQMVAWEGERASGTVKLEASGSGTRVTMEVEVRDLETDDAVPALTVHRLIPDLEAWDRSAAELEHRATWQTAAAQRAAERATQRAGRERKRGPGRRLFRGRRAEPNQAPVLRSPLPEPALSESAPSPPTSAAARELAAGAAEERARAVLETALENLGAERR